MQKIVYNIMDLVGIYAHNTNKKGAILIKFEQLSLSDDIMRVLDKRGFITATNVQAETIPLIRSGRDILAQSRTGTGKTLAFSIPCVEAIEKDKDGVQALILSPTRELAQQCGDEVRKLIKYMPHVKTADIYGGGDYKTQFRALRVANLVIGTPGRIMDHMKRGTLKLQNLKMIILDEADEMLNMGFKEDIETILKDAPTERQTLLFSATIPKGIQEITNQFQTDAIKVNLVKDNATLTAIKQVFVQIPKQYKDEALKLLIYYYKPKRSIIFANTKSMVDELTQKLCDFGILARGLHGDMRQNQRTAVMAEFKSGKTEILIATDVAARGIDVNDIDYVFNYDIPKMSEYYVHRIGRTGRAGKEGTAVTLCCGKQQFMAIRDLSRKLKCEIDEMKMPSSEDIKDQEFERNVKRVHKYLAKEPTQNHVQIVETLVKSGYNHEQIALALAGIAFKNSSAGLVSLPSFKVASHDNNQGERGKRGKREHGSLGSFGKIKLSIGRSSRCSANHIVGAITERTSVTSKVIGKIIIDDEHSIVEVPNDMLHEIVAEMANIKICGKHVKVSALKGAVRHDKGTKGDKGGRDRRFGKSKRQGSKYGKSKKYKDAK